MLCERCMQLCEPQPNATHIYLPDTSTHARCRGAGTTHRTVLRTPIPASSGMVFPTLECEHKPLLKPAVQHLLTCAFPSNQCPGLPPCCVILLSTRSLLVQQTTIERCPRALPRNITTWYLLNSMSFCFFAHVVCPCIHLFFLFARTAAEQLHPWRRRRRQRIVTASYEQTSTILFKLMERVHGQVTLLAHERKLCWKDNLACIGTLSVAFTSFCPSSKRGQVWCDPRS